MRTQPPSCPGHDGPPRLRPVRSAATPQRCCQKNANRSPLPLPHRAVRRREARAARRERLRGSSCRCRDLGGGAPLESGCGLRYALRRTSAKCARAGTTTSLARVVETTGASSQPYCSASVPSRGHHRVLVPSKPHCRALSYDGLWPSVTLNRFPEKFQRCLAITSLGDDALQPGGSVSRSSGATLLFDACPGVLCRRTGSPPAGTYRGRSPRQCDGGARNASPVRSVSAIATVTDRQGRMRLEGRRPAR